MAEQKKSSSSSDFVLWAIAFVAVAAMFSSKSGSPQASGIDSYTSYEAPVQVASTLEDIDANYYIGTYYTVTQTEYILLCNLVAREYGADFVSVEEKARVAQTVMNRVANPAFPDNVEAVISAPGQYDGYLPGYYYNEAVTESVQEAVLYCLNGYCTWDNSLYYWGDGCTNHFYVDHDSFWSAYCYFLNNS